MTSIAGHFCIDAFAAISPLPVIDLTVALRGWMDDRSVRRVGILGTGTVMASGMYGKLAPATVLAPEGDGLDRVHAAYVALAQSGEATQERRAVFVSEAQAMIDRGAEAVLLGGTDLNACFGPGDDAFPMIDCANIHVDAIFAEATKPTA